MFTIYHGAKRLCLSRASLHLNRNKIFCITQKEIHLKSRIFTLVVDKRSTALCQGFADNVLKKPTFVSTQIAIHAKVTLGLIIKLPKQKATIRKIYLEFVLSLVATYRQFRKTHCMANIYYTSILQPIHTSTIILESRIFSHFGYLKFPVLLRKLLRYMVKHIQDARLIYTISIFPHIITIRKEQLSLKRR